MRLDGRLEDFSLPDVLQLLTATSKTGALLLDAADGGRQGVIRLGAGAVDGASSDLHRQALARRLVGAGMVTDEALEQAAADARGGASLVRALLDRSGLDADAVAGIAREHATDAACELLRWSAGSFSFRIGEPDPDGLALGLRVDELVAEGERRRQVWPSLTSHIPSPDTVLRLVASPAFDPSCTREEWGLLALVDGVRSVSEIVALLGRSEFAVAGALAALVERGLLQADAAGSGLADLQRRQSVISALEIGAPQVPAPAAPVAPAADVPAIADRPAPAVSPAAAVTDVPAARISTEAPVQEAPVQEAPAPEAEPAAPTAQARPAVPVTSTPIAPVDGSSALDPATLSAPADQPAIRGLDSAVTKSLVLRLIAGVRSL
jgi:hypothetical protein